MDLCFLFIYLTLQSPSGTGIKMYGTHLSPGIDYTTRMTLSLNGNITDKLLNNTGPAGGISLMYYAENMEVGDHQFSGRLTLLSGRAFGIVYFECVALLFQFVPRTVCH